MTLVSLTARGAAGVRDKARAKFARVEKIPSGGIRTPMRAHQAINSNNQDVA